MTSEKETPVPAAPALAPTPKQIDALILEHAAAQAYLQSGGAVKKIAGESAAQITARLKAHLDADGAFKKTALEAANEIKARLTEMVETFGVRHSEKTRRLDGLHNTVKSTTGTRTVVVAAAVDGVKTYLDGLEMPDLVEKFFSKHISYSLVNGSDEVLKTLTLATRIRTKLTNLLGLTSKVVTNAPYLTFETVDPTKPVTTAKAA